MKKHLNTFSKLVVGLLLTIGFARQAQACAGGDECWNGECSSILSPEIIGDATCSPYFRSGRIFYQTSEDMGEKTREEIQKINTNEWGSLLDGRVDGHVLEDLIYKSDAAELDRLAAAIESRLGFKGKWTYVNAYQSLNVDNASKRQFYSQAVAYLAIARRVEPLATLGLEENFAWNPEKKVERIKQLSVDSNRIDAAAQSLLALATDPRLVSRIHFQRMRLRFYSAEYSEAYQYYQQNKAAMGEVESIKYRSMELAAGSIYRTGQYAVSNYMFAQIFDQYGPLQKNAYFSFHPQEQQDWLQTLSMAQNPAELATLWAMFGIYADGFEAIRRIYEVDKTSKYLPLLLVREVNKLEEDFKWFAGWWGYADERKERPQLAERDLLLIKNITDAANTPKPYVWQVSLAHIYALLDRAKDAEVYLQKAQASAPKLPLIQDQIRLVNFFNKLNAIKTVQPEMEDYLASEMNWIRLSDRKFPETRGEVLYKFARKKLSDLYAARGDLTRSIMLLDRPKSELYQNNASVTDLIRFKSGSHSKAFDRMLAEIYVYSVDELWNIHGINNLFEGRFAQAATSFEQMKGPSSNVSLIADPFKAGIKDCFECASSKGKTYTKATFARELDSLTKLATGTDQAAADASLLLGHGLYNMTAYGHSRDVYWTEQSNFSDSKIVRRFNMAESYYNRAAQLSNNSEFKAKAVLMAAKCENNRFYTEKWEKEQEGLANGRYYDFSEAVPPVGENFRRLKAEFATTAYYREIIRECGYFRNFAK